MTGASSKIDVCRLKEGDLIIKTVVLCVFTRSSIPCSRSVVISVPVTQQWRHLRGYDVSNTVTGSRQHDNFTEFIAINASGVAMRMNVL